MRRLLAAAALTAALLGGAPALAGPAAAAGAGTGEATGDASAPSEETPSEAPESEEPSDADRVEEVLEGTETPLETALRIAEELDESPVYVDDRMTDRYTESTIAGLEEKVAATKHPTYLVLVWGLDYEASSTLATLIANAHGGEGVFIVPAVNGDLTHEVDLADIEDEFAVDQQFYRYRIDPDQRMSDIEWLNDVLDRLADPQYEEYETTFGDKARQAVSYYPGRTVFVAGLALVVLVGGVWLVARKRPVRTRKYRIPDSVMAAARDSDRSKMRSVLGQDALRIAEKLEALQTEGLTEAQSETVQRGLDAFGLARRIAEDESAAEDDLVGSLVLFDIAERSLESVERQRSARLTGGRPLRGPCTVNPRHGEAHKEGKVTAGGGNDLTVPMCAKCALEQRRGHPLQWLRVGGAPYPDRDTVWARTLYGATEADLVEEVIRARAMR